jgi:hypothetical protein
MPDKRAVMKQFTMLYKEAITQPHVKTLPSKTRIRQQTILLCR